MVMPASAIIGIPLSGWLVSKFDNRIPLQVASFTFLLSLLSLVLPIYLVGCIGFSCFFYFIKGD
jgi:biotin transporter BioY